MNLENGQLKKSLHLAIIAVYGIVFCLISLVNHYNFRTYAFDLGLFNNALYDFAHFRNNDYSLIKERFSNPLADHFSLITHLVSPLYWVFGSYTMLIVQIAAILFGAQGVYIYFKTRSEKDFLPELAMIHFLSIWGIYSALAFDYHDNVIAAMLIPWFFHYIDNKKKWPSVLVFILVLISKENMALWMTFICIGLVFMYYPDREKRLFMIILSIISLFYFFIIVKVVMPNIGAVVTGKEYYHFKYSILGANFKDAITIVLTKPLFVLKSLFINHLENTPDGDGIKTELFKMLLYSGGIFLLLRPPFLFMLIPVFLQKLLSDDYVKWGINLHYSIEFVPILTLACFSWIANCKYKHLSIALIVVVLTGASTLYSLKERVSKWYWPESHQFYNRSHYICEYNRSSLLEAINFIPPNAKVSAHTQMVPRLAFREVIYQFPTINDAEYLVLLKGENTYPLSKEELQIKINEYQNSNEWVAIYKKNNVFVFKKRQNTLKPL